MSEKHLPQQEKFDEETPEWLKLIQLNSWEAELLISALFLYILFQIPDAIDLYRKVHFSPGGQIFGILGFFRKALIVLSIGYVIHIITRGIWVANIGLSYVFPRGIDLDKLRLKGKFRKELEGGSGSLNDSVLMLEKLASMAYAVSFISSALVISVGMVFFTVILYVEYLLQPSIESGIGWLYLLTLFILIVYGLVLLLVFVDFITNGFFRRDPWASKPYYYVMMVFRVLTLSFIYNRMLLTIISSLPRWQAHMIPVAFVSFLGLYQWITNSIVDRSVDTYYEQSFEDIHYENYESLRNEQSLVVATIQSDLIEENVLRLFIDGLEELSSLHGKNPKRDKEWHELGSNDKIVVLNEFLDVKVDSVTLDEVSWRHYKHPGVFSMGYLSYIDIGQLESGEHRLVIEYDTLAMSQRQKDYLAEFDPSRYTLASIPFYKVP